MNAISYNSGNQTTDFNTSAGVVNQPGSETPSVSSNQSYYANNRSSTTPGLATRGVTPVLSVQSQTTDGTTGNITTTYTNGLSVVTTKTGSVIGTPLTVADSTTNPNGDKVTTFTSGVVITIRPDGSVAIS